MIRKHNLLVAILFCVSLSAFCGVYDDINGVWVNDWNDEVALQLEPVQTQYTWGEGIELPENFGWMFDIDDSGKGFFRAGYFKGKVLRVEKCDAWNGYDIYCCDEYYGEITYTIDFMTEDSLYIDNYHDLRPGISLFRISAPVKKIYGTAMPNKNEVSLYNSFKDQGADKYHFAPQFKIATLKTSSEVQIIDKTDAPDKKNGEKYCWYKVRCLGYPDGWVYGEDLKILKLEK